MTEIDWILLRGFLLVVSGMIGFAIFIYLAWLMVTPSRFRRGDVGLPTYTTQMECSCGWVGRPSGLSENGDCPSCGWPNNLIDENDPLASWQTKFAKMISFT